MFGEVAIPEAVWHEVVLTGQNEPGASEVKNASWITRQAIQNTLLARSLEASIDRGEAEAIVLAIEQESEIILLDEKPARDQALSFHLRPLGTIGILLWGTQHQCIPELKPVLNKLVNEGNFRLSNDLSRHPENHLCKEVDEWFSGRDSAQTPVLAGAEKGTPAVKPGGFISSSTERSW